MESFSDLEDLALKLLKEMPDFTYEGDPRNLIEILGVFSVRPKLLEDCLQDLKESSQKKDSSEYSLALAAVYSWHGNHDKGAAEYAELAAKGKKRLSAQEYVQWASCLLNLEDMTSAAKVLENGLKKYPEEQGLIRRLLVCYARLGNKKGVLEMRQRLLEQYEKQFYLMYMAALSGYYQQGYAVGQNIERSLPEEELFQPGMLPFGVTYLSCMGESADIAEFHEKAEKCLKHFPNDPNLLNTVGYVYADRNVYLDLAEKYLQRARRMLPDASEIADSLAWLYFRQGKLDLAKKEMFESLVLAGSEPAPEILDHAGDIFLSSGDLRAALKYW